MEPSSATMRLSVALLTESELLNSGLEALLMRMPSPPIITRITPPLGDQFSFDGIDLLIVSIDQWKLLEELTGVASGSRPKIAVIGDELDAYDVSLFSSLPADGFLSMKDLSADQLVEILRRVMAEEMPMPPKLARLLLNSPRPLVIGPNDRLVMLTPREQEALELLVQGLGNKQMARALGISMHGSKRLVAAVLLKLGAPNRTAAAVAAIKSGLV